MADSQISRPKRQGNYTPARIKEIEPDIAAKYAANQSAKSLAREYGISKNTVRAIAERHGIAWRDRQTAGFLCRTVHPVSEAEANDPRPVAQQVAEKHGYGSSKGLSYDREFLTACAKENRRRNAESRRELERKRKQFLNRIPAWANREAIRDFYELAAMFGMTVDHDAPLQGENICGLHVETNLKLMSLADNVAKGNRFVVGPDPVIERIAEYHRRVQSGVQS